MDQIFSLASKKTKFIELSIFCAKMILFESMRSPRCDLSKPYWMILSWQKTRTTIVKRRRARKITG